MGNSKPPYGGFTGSGYLANPEKIIFTPALEVSVFYDIEVRYINAGTSPAAFDLYVGDYKIKQVSFEVTGTSWQTKTISVPVGVMEGYLTFVRKTGSVAFDNFVISKGSELDFVESLQVSGEGGKNQVKIGNTLQMVVTFIPPDSSVTVVAWSVKNPDGTDTDKAIIDPVTGLLTALKAGDVRVIATALDGSGVTGYATIHIPTPGYLVTISANYTPDVGETFVVTFTVKDSGDVDASFNGVITVTASGVTASPATYGTVNGSVINGGRFRSPSPLRTEKGRCH